MPDDWRIGKPTDTAVSNPASSGTVIALLKGMLTALGGGGAGTGSVSVTDGTDTLLIGGTNKAARVELYDALGGAISKAVDAAYLPSDPGIQALAVRIDTPAALANADGDYIPLSTDATGVQWVHPYDTATHDSVDAGAPIKIGYKAIAHGTNPTAVAANDRTNSYANRAGIPWVMGGHPNILTKNLNVTDADGAQTDTALVTISTGSKIVVTLIQVMADGANSGDVAVRIGFGTANTPAVDAAGIVFAHPGIKAGGGAVVGNGGGMIGVGADDEDLRLTCEDPAGGAVDITVSYYTVPS